MANNPMRERQAAAAAYGRVLAQIEAVRPDMAKSVRAYVTALHGEAAMFRVEANRLREQIDRRGHA